MYISVYLTAAPSVQRNLLPPVVVQWSMKSHLTAQLSQRTCKVALVCGKLWPVGLWMWPPYSFGLRHV